ncbi:MAG: 30S ribosomal protein S9 [Chitinophagales bacterium]|nr:30S ribosomal protein S9 [Chitinophagales bacterium]MDW8273972.1 30S ribosomal protein S9 [Chitinophagales bacterium]
MEKLTVGRRKTAVARANVKSGSGTILVNGKDYKEYFPSVYLQHKVEAPLKVAGMEGALDISINVKGGGIKGQAEAISLAIARSIAAAHEDKRILLKKEKLLRRDARIVERKKTGLRKARKKEQYSKR